MSVILLLVMILFTQSSQAQQDLCTCSCCATPSCIPSHVGSFYIPSCTGQNCLDQCRSSFSQCQQAYPNGVVSPQCISTPTNLYSCRCDCCNTGSTSCAPTYAGDAVAYVCQPGACSISCAVKYPYQCVSNQNGVTNGICLGLLTTTTTTTTTTSMTAVITASNGFGTGTLCRCMCCHSGLNCSPNIDAGFVTASPCSASTCTQACQKRYSATCPSLSYLGQTNGMCASLNSGRTVCRCQCCIGSGCPSYQFNINEDCTACPRLCQLSSLCGYVSTMTYTCAINQSKKSIECSLRLIFVLLLSIFIQQYRDSCTNDNC